MTLVCGVEELRFTMPPAVSRTEWTPVPQFVQHQPYSELQPLALPSFMQGDNVLLSSAALPTSADYTMMPYDVEGLSTGNLSFNNYNSACPNILDRNPFETGSDYNLLGTRTVFSEVYNTTVDDMANAPIWSTAYNKTIKLEVPDCWINKNMCSWTETDTSEWLNSNCVGVTDPDILLQYNYLTGERLLELYQNDQLANIEHDLQLNLRNLIQQQLDSERNTLHNNHDLNTLPAYNTSYEQHDNRLAIKEEETSLEYPGAWGHPSHSGYGAKPNHQCSDDESEDAAEEEVQAPSARGRPGRRGRPPSVGSRASKRKHEKRHGRLWEFIRDLLKNPEYCPSLICWENHDEGVFRFVSSEKVAQLWGSKRGNTKMTYEKLSRAMRYYYKSNILQPVTHRRLVYRFGPNATNWRHPNPNFRRPV